MICIKCGEKLDSEQCRNCDFDLKAHYFSLIPFLYGYGIGQFYHSLAQGLRLKKQSVWMKNLTRSLLLWRSMQHQKVSPLR